MDVAGPHGRPGLSVPVNVMADRYARGRCGITTGQIVRDLKHAMQETAHGIEETATNTVMQVTIMDIAALVHGEDMECAVVTVSIYCIA